MKNFFLICSLALLMHTTANAQFLKFGLKAGVNFADVDTNNLDANTYTSFHFGGVLEFKVLEKFSIQPEVLYSSQGAKVNEEAFEDINYNYITVPVLAKIYLISEKLSLEAGPQFSFLMNDNLKEEWESKSFDFAAVGGLGIQITDNVFAQGRYVLGLTDTTSDAEIKNRVIQVSVGYRF